jgi:hypothetical protein
MVLKIEGDAFAEVSGSMILPWKKEKENCTREPDRQHAQRMQAA